MDERERLLRTMYVARISSMMTEMDIRRVFERCGEIVLIKICGNPTQETRFAFVEFGSMEGAIAAQSLDGTPVNGYNLRIMQAKSTIQASTVGAAGGGMGGGFGGGRGGPGREPRSHQNMVDPSDPFVRDQLSRTLYFGSIDSMYGEPTIVDYLERMCGPIAKFRLCGGEGHRTRYGFAEFTTLDGAQRGHLLNGTMFGSFELRVMPSRQPILGPTRPQHHLGMPPMHSYPGAYDVSGGYVAHAPAPSYGYYGGGAGGAPMPAGSVGYSTGYSTGYYPNPQQQMPTMPSYSAPAPSTTAAMTMAYSSSLPQTQTFAKPIPSKAAKSSPPPTISSPLSIAPSVPGVPGVPGAPGAPGVSGSTTKIVKSSPPASSSTSSVISGEKTAAVVNLLLSMVRGGDGGDLTNETEDDGETKKILQEVRKKLSEEGKKDTNDGDAKEDTGDDKGDQQDGDEKELKGILKRSRDAEGMSEEQDEEQKEEETEKPSDKKRKKGDE
eukprot:TRINITY_DN645_c0_g3_i1.p1 TRINITY_DN645_c0_g3~~TRINITY_DN645_c0_g3_i1.p1  ORF type:complete len:519 (+),score=158.94 TRINITY_DN645_c0_g3_i1:74-1558(+)